MMRLYQLINKLIVKIRKLYALKIERGLYMNWINPFATIYFNFRLLPFSQAVRLPIFVYGWPRVLSLYGKAEIQGGGGKFGVVKLNRSRHVAGAPSNMGGRSEFNIWGKIVFKGRCQIGTGGKISIGENGVLILGDDSKIMAQCCITAYRRVEIGEHLRMAHCSQIFDTSYHYVADLNKKRVGRLASNIMIGRNCWLCNYSTLMGGAVIPAYTIVASHSLVNKDMSDIPNNSIVGGSPAKLVATGHRRVYEANFEAEIDKYFSENPESNYCTFDLQGLRDELPETGETLRSANVLNRIY